jgi:hypothetical protein
MNHSLLAISVAILFLDHGLRFRLVLLDHGAIVVAMFTDSHAGADGACANANFIAMAGAATAQARAAANRYFFILFSLSV